ncbi:MAG: DUF6069 family protein [Acidimicrobiales bacterium]
MRGAVLGCGIAFIGNAVIFAIGNVGTPVRVVTGWAPDGADLSLAEVAITTIVSIAAGTAILAALDHRRRNALRPWTILAAVVAAASAAPVWRLDVDTGSKLTLTLMHIWTGAAAVAGHQLLSRHRLPTTPRPARSTTIAP